MTHQLVRETKFRVLCLHTIRVTDVDGTVLIAVEFNHWRCFRSEARNVSRVMLSHQVNFAITRPVPNDALNGVVLV